MTESAFHWITFLGGAVVQIAIAAYVYGKLTQSVSSLGDGLKAESSNRETDIERIDEDQKEQWGVIGNMREDLGKVKGKLGINGVH